MNQKGRRRRKRGKKIYEKGARNGMICHEMIFKELTKKKRNARSM